jgi:DNA-binding beta-propeller fold protein YncE
MNRGFIASAGLTALALASPVQAGGQAFINWESPHVSSLAMTPNGTKLLAVNTADNRLEIFDITANGLSHGGHLASVPVGLDPVSVRPRTNTEAWVINRISDSISIVDLNSMNVIRTIRTADEPGDVVFAGSPQRAFVSIAEPTPGLASGGSAVAVYDPANLAAPPVMVSLQGREARMLATDGERVYVALFESGNRTTILRRATVNEPDGPYAGQNPPPNDGAVFNPPIAPDLPPPPAVSHIVRRPPGDEHWLDDNNADWSEKVTWGLHDHGVAIIDADSLDVAYVRGTMNINMALALRGETITVVGTDALNWIRFEPNINGVFARVNMASFGPEDSTPTIVDLNPHLEYSTPGSRIPWETRVQSIGDPRGIAWSSDGARGFITGMGSNNIIIIDEGGNRLGRIDVGEGPTGIALDELHGKNGRLYVLNRFEGSVSVIDIANEAEVQRVHFHDPTPQAVRVGRPLLYDTHRTSGLGHVSCATCHVDGRMDGLAWDLGTPQGAMTPAPNDCGSGFVPAGFQGPCEDFHPMKGPMVTQTLIGILDNGPMHWRGDRENLHAFDSTFTDLQAMEEVPTQDEMDAFEAFLATTRFPPNPNLTFFNQFRDSLPHMPGSPIGGFVRFDHDGHVSGGRCTNCHVTSGPPAMEGSGTDGLTTPTAFLGEVQTFKTPHLRNLYKKTGFQRSSQMSDRGFGFLHDGSDDTLLAFLDKPGFAVGGFAERFIALLVSFPTGAHAATGVQVTLDSTTHSDPAVVQLVNDMQSVANQGHVSIVAKGLVNGEHRGYAYLGGGSFQSDRAGQTTTMTGLRNAAAAGAVITVTVVPAGSQVRIGIDRDEDGYFDRDELDAGSDPANADSVPGNPCPWLTADLNNDCVVDVIDLLLLLDAWGECPGQGVPVKRVPVKGVPVKGGCDNCPADLNGDCSVDVLDLLVLLDEWQVQ